LHSTDRVPCQLWCQKCVSLNVQCGIYLTGMLAAFHILCYQQYFEQSMPNQKTVFRLQSWSWCLVMYRESQLLQFRASAFLWYLTTCKAAWQQQQLLFEWWPAGWEDAQLTEATTHSWGDHRAEDPARIETTWAARYNTSNWLLIKLTLKGVVFSFLFLSRDE